MSYKVLRKRVEMARRLKVLTLKFNQIIYPLTVMANFDCQFDWIDGICDIHLWKCL